MLSHGDIHSDEGPLQGTSGGPWRAIAGKLFLERLLKHP